MAFDIRYSFTERLLHRLAFRSAFLQTGIAEIEDSIYESQLNSVPIDRPVFVTGLPRSGTTLLLNLCVESGQFASHTYRDMPFLFAPILWRQMSSVFQRNEVARERAHGDGIMVNVDSPEALEEVVWKTLWKSQYRDDEILPWGSESSREFTEVFQRHLKKIIYLGEKNTTESKRYISKNNLNIARLHLLRNCIPDAVILVPFRHPLQHALSLLRQHRNFLQIHASDSFAKEYMADVGHFDFGENLKPINFSDWRRESINRDPLCLNFWLEYWCATYESALRQKAGADHHFLCFERFCERPKEGLSRLCELAGIETSETMLSQSANVKPASSIEDNDIAVDMHLKERAEALYQELQSTSRI